MKNTQKALVALAGAVVMVSCGESKKENLEDKPGMPMQNEMHQESSGEENGNLDNGKAGDVAFNDDKVTAAYQHYMHIKTALVNTDAKEAQKGGEMLVESLTEIENTKASEAAQIIAGTEKVNEQRTAFLDLSSAMEEVLSGAIASGEIYKQYCPMAFDGQGGAWLSASSEVRNPYYGDMMLKCGSVRDTLQ